MATVTTIAVAASLAARASVIAEAQSWLGTPFHHAARVKGVGVDCAQLLLACYVDLKIVAPVEPEYYAPDWFRHQDGETFREWVAKRCVPTATPTPGDIGLFRYGRSASHGAVCISDSQLIHAFRGRGVVLDSFAPGTPLAARFDSAWSPWGTS